MKFDPAGDIGYQLGILLDGGIELGQEVRGGFVEVTLDGAETRVEHNLGYTPSGYFVMRKDAEGDVWAVRLTDWDSVSLYLATSATNQGVRLYVL
jgi:hypothetical protein